MSKPIWYISCTRQHNAKDTLLGQCLLEAVEQRGAKINFHFITDNKMKLSAVYNSILSNDAFKDSYVIFVHDDVYLVPEAVNVELVKALQENDVIGLAGATKTSIQRPALWHLMTDRKNLSGAVAHQYNADGRNVFYMTPFGAYPQQCVLLDGVFLAVNVEKLIAANVKFDDSNPAIAHFYDLDFCMSAKKANLKLSTWPIYITHCSPGLNSLEDKEWNKGQDWFMNKWSPKVNLF